MILYHHGDSSSSVLFDAFCKQKVIKNAISPRIFLSLFYQFPIIFLTFFQKIGIKTAIFALFSE